MFFTFVDWDSAEPLEEPTRFSARGEPGSIGPPLPIDGWWVPIENAPGTYVRPVDLSDDRRVAVSAQRVTASHWARAPSGAYTIAQEVPPDAADDNRITYRRVDVVANRVVDEQILADESCWVRRTRFDSRGGDFVALWLRQCGVDRRLWLRGGSCR